MANVLYFDIETAPLVAHVWGIWQQNVGLPQIIQDPYILGVGYSRNGEKPKYISEAIVGRQAMLEQTRDLLSWADVVTGWNSDRYDARWCEGELLREGIDRPSPYKQIDLMKVAKKHFYFPSYKLQYVSTALGLEGKHETGGHSLWIKCMEGDRAAIAKMGRYCRNDVALLIPLFEKLRPYFPASINFALLNGVEHLACQKCGADDKLQSRGTYYTAQSAFPQYRCGHCGGWTRDTRRVGAARGAGAS